jgi:protein-arginine kinase activator protein McsA
MNKLKRIFCVLFEHAPIFTVDWGIAYCKRCGEQIYDSFTSNYDLSDCVIESCACEKCKDNYKKLKWIQKFWCGNPFKTKNDELEDVHSNEEERV